MGSEITGMSKDDLSTHNRRTIYSSGFFRSGILSILAWPLLCLMLALGLWYWTISKIDAEKRACEKKVLQEASALCNDYAHYLALAIEQANQITLQLQYGREQTHKNLYLQELSQRGLFRNPRIVNVLILSRDGMPATAILGNPQNVSNADRDYFVYHKNDDSNALLVGKPLVLRSTGKPAITFSRRLNTPQGAFDGVALVAFDPPYLTAFNAGSFPGKTGVLMVAGLDGTLRSAISGNAAQDPMSATLRAVPLFNSPEGASYISGEQWFGDKLSRYVAWKTLKEYPLVAMVGLSEQDYFAPYQKAWATDRTVAISGSIILFLFASAAAGMSTRLVRKKHQEEEVRTAYRIATEGGNEGFYMYEAIRDKSGAIVDFVLVDCNERGAEFYDTVQILLLQRKLSSLYPAAYFEALMIIFRGAMVTGFYEDETRTPDESPLQIEWAKRRLVRSGNGLAVTVQDITEQKNAKKAALILEQQLQQAQKMEAIGTLAGGVAHDFNNKLMVIMGNTALARMNIDDRTKVLNHLEEINQAAEYSRDITARLLAFSRRQVICPQILKANQIIADALKSLNRLIGEHIAITFIPDDTLWNIEIDPVQLDQIVMNLAVNARDAMPDGGTFTIRSENITMDSENCSASNACVSGEYVCITFSDSGTGMDQETLTHIFEPFFTTKEVGKGTGLGLATIYGIITQNNGFIDVTSTLGSGTVCKVYLPRYDAPATDTMKADDALYSCNASLLLVEDEESVRQVTAQFLKIIGYSVYEAATPRQALELVANLSIKLDLVLTDFIMPEMNGKVLMERIREIRPDIKYIFASGYSTDHALMAEATVSGDNFIQKPYNLKKLSEHLKRVMEA